MALADLPQRAVASFRGNPNLSASIAIFSLSWLVYGFFTLSCSDSWNDLSRMAAIQSVVERSDWRIAPSDFTPLTFDKVFINGHYYSDKTPTLNLIGAGVYWGLRNGFGVRLAACTDAEVPKGYYWLTVLIVGLSSATLAVIFFLFLRQQQAGLAVALGLTALLAFGTEIFPYSVVFNHHVPSAAAILGSWYILNCAQDKPKASLRVWLGAAGFLAGLAATFDLLAGLFAAGIFGLALVRHKGNASFFILGGLLPVGLMLLLDYQMIGTIIPPYMVPNGYKFPGSRFPNTVAGNRPPADAGLYAFDMFLGARGILAYCPVLVMGLVGMAGVMRDRRHPHWAEAWMVALSSAALVTYLLVSTFNFGGTAYGERWLVLLVPPIMLFAVYVPHWFSKQQPIWRVVSTILLMVAIVWSTGSALQGALQPWKQTLPPMYLTSTADAPMPVGLKFTWR